MEVLHFMFGIFGNATALFLFLSPIVTFWRIMKSRSTEDFSGMPYTMTMLNCLLSAWYGLPFVSPNNLLVSTINGTGAVIEAVYVVLFLAMASQKGRLKMTALLALVLAVFATVALVSLLALHGDNRKIFCGFAAAIFSICMYASPLSIMRLVIKTKSVEYMPFLLSLFVFLCGTSWFIYGLLGHDPFVSVPNGVGSFLGAVQLLLYGIYRNNKGNNYHSDGDALKNNEKDIIKEASDHINDSIVIDIGEVKRPLSPSPPSKLIGGILNCKAASPTKANVAFIPNKVEMK